MNARMHLSSGRPFPLTPPRFAFIGKIKLHAKPSVASPKTHLCGTLQNVSKSPEPSRGSKFSVLAFA